MNKSFIYLRGLKHVNYSVFCVTSDDSNKQKKSFQKTFYDPQFGITVPYSSGQQVKRSIISDFLDVLGEKQAPITFVSVKDKSGKIGEGEVYSTCDPSYKDLLLGGWMQAKAGGTDRTLKRRSPLSISALTPLHPLLASVPYPAENISFDRSDYPELHKIIVRDTNGNELSDEEIANALNGSNRSLLRKYIQDNKRATGLFVYDIAIDLRRLFCVPTNQFEPEISNEMIAHLEKKGWQKSENVFGECLVLPKEERDKVIPALAHAMLNWRITSNQSRTFSLMETLAVAISDNANTIPGAIRAKLIDEGGHPTARPIIDETAGADVFVTLPCANYIVTENESADALDAAEQKLIQMMRDFDYENQ